MATVVASHHRPPPRAIPLFHVSNGGGVVDVYGGVVDVYGNGNATSEQHVFALAEKVEERSAFVNYHANDAFQRTNFTRVLFLPISSYCTSVG
jgi:hypothetical protein